MTQRGTNIKYRGFMIDYHLRKESHMKRYSGKMIIYKEDLSFIVRSNLRYLPDASISNIFKEADKIIDKKFPRFINI